MDEQGLLRVLGSLGVSKIKRSGDRLIASCPLAPYNHKKGTDRSPSFSISINPGGPSKYKCWSCGIAGNKTISLLYAVKDSTGLWRTDLHGLIRDQEQGSPRERLRRLGDFEERRRASVGSQGESFWHVDGYERKFTSDEMAEWVGKVPRYVLERGVTKEQCKLFELGYDQQHQRLVIPLRDEHGRLVGWSKRAIHAEDEPKYLHAKGMARDKYLYGENLVKRSIRTGILVEGFFDVWAFQRRGYVNALGTMGTALSSTHVSKLRNFFDRVLIFPHNDPKPDPTPANPNPTAPGLKMAHTYRDAMRLSGIQVGIAPVITGRKDPGDWSDEDFATIEPMLGNIVHELKCGRACAEGGQSERT